jgi:lipoate-protein ligase A
MNLLDELQLPVTQQLALDECLLLAAEGAAPGTAESFRLWELDAPAVILGRGSRWQEEVDVEACLQASVPIVRRCSGGATVVGGPGCLFYSVILDRHARPELRVLDQAHRFVLERLNRGLQSLGCDSHIAGTSDLALATKVGLQKVSGNSLRLRRDHLLYHGTLLYDANLDQIASLLRTPPRQPDYRDGRSHARFLTQLPVAGDRLREAIIAAWSPLDSTDDWPQADSLHLANEKYATDDWNHRL